MVETVVKAAEFDSGSGQSRDELLVDCRKLLQGGLPFRKIGLIRNQEQEKACRAQCAHCVEDTRDEYKIGGGEGGFEYARGRIEDVAIDYAIAIEKDRSLPTMPICSHFISFLLSRGCDTIRCQMTA